MNAYKRLHGLIVDVSGLDSTIAAKSAAPEGVDRTMRSFQPPRSRRTTRRRPWRSSAPIARERFVEDRIMNPPPMESEVREDLVARVRQEIQQGTYDTPEKFQAALDRLADRLESD